jgi:hypothetical protein
MVPPLPSEEKVRGLHLQSTLFALLRLEITLLSSEAEISVLLSCFSHFWLENPILPMVVLLLSQSPIFSLWFGFV